ncbi:hypothetical protein AAFF_G00400370 [Aldrovandia affinis]|uniref:Uncharacterized protein n=1 Tax=Aldrovandia affinis TaxID=143900 RepID=A0AAD7SCS7_9TELE|nr:hypothetical protein AAFF_G00400370 [Aldrovandia affinis]
MISMVSFRTGGVLYANPGDPFLLGLRHPHGAWALSLSRSKAFLRVLTPSSGKMSASAAFPASELSSRWNGEL